MDDTDKMCVYEGYNKARDCRQETLVKYEVHRYMNTNEWINAATSLDCATLFEMSVRRAAATFPSVMSLSFARLTTS
jgi:hypothetical protein